ncbi:MauE/DoxX family redox-associated membrane protein [Actomonas aquatica]|uniref:MauE/DoxX family redox-associated membrane protein n=1 Tax=Actomonas aquatica TaxID=2866162 RepID=A0ABZ1CDS3_9BACT|nr:MauE/DoxX family redox-associated membrane protein [Opitutus sp. WL0086]WRQ89834.1 MauE/DoxX family redox-associated membrane protein [Opitutus sp. WL0086]
MKTPSLDAALDTSPEAPCAAAARMLSGLLFAGSGVLKLSDPSALTTAIERYELVSPALASVGGHILPWAELTTGAALLFNVCRRGAWLNACGFSLLFLLAVASAWYRGLDISCGCFGADRTIDAGSLAFNVALLALTTWGLRQELRREKQR